MQKEQSHLTLIKMVAANIELTHQRLMTLKNRTSMMAKAIMPALDDLKSRIANTNQKLTSQHRVMQMAHHRYNLLFRCIILPYYSLRISNNSSRYITENTSSVQ